MIVTGAAARHSGEKIFEAAVFEEWGLKLKRAITMTSHKSLTRRKATTSKKMVR